MITISYRSIKIATIFIAILILSAIAIPAVSQQTIREGITLELPAPREMGISPTPEFLDAMTVKMSIKDVVQLGIWEIAENRHGWAYVHLRNDDPLDFSTIPRILYIPGTRIQTLFETAMAKDIRITVFAHPMERPDGWPGSEEMTLYKVTSAFLTYWPDS